MIGFRLVATSTTHPGFPRFEESHWSEGGLGADSSPEKRGFDVLNGEGLTESCASNDLSMTVEVVIDKTTRFAAQLLSGTAGDTLKTNSDTHLNDVQTGIRQAIIKAVIAFMRYIQDNPPRAGQLCITVYR